MLGAGDAEKEIELVKKCTPPDTRPLPVPFNQDAVIQSVNCRAEILQHPIRGHLRVIGKPEDGSEMFFYLFLTLFF